MRSAAVRDYEHPTGTDRPRLLAERHLFRAPKAELPSRGPPRGQAVERDPLRSRRDEVAGCRCHPAIVQTAVMALRDVFDEIGHADAV